MHQDVNDSEEAMQRSEDRKMASEAGGKPAECG